MPPNPKTSRLQKINYIKVVSLFFAPLNLCRGANPQVADQDGRTALQCAIDGGTSDDDILVLLEDYTR